MSDRNTAIRQRKHSGQEWKEEKKNTHTVAPVWRAELSCPGGGGCTRSAGGRAAVCGASAGRVSRFWGVFIIIAVHRALCWGWGPGFSILSRM